MKINTSPNSKAPFDNPKNLFSGQPDFFKCVLNAIEDPVFVKDENHCWVYLNSKACAMFGKPAEELLGMSDYDLFPKEQADVFWAMDRKVMESGKSNLNIEEITIHEKQRSIATNKSVFSDPASGKRYIIGTIRDITHVQQAKRALYESEARFQELAKMLPETVYEMDLTGRLTFVNENAYTMFGYTERDFEAGLFGLSMLAPECRDIGSINLENLISGQKADRQEYQMLRKDGTMFPAIIFSAPVFQDGRICGLRGLIVDITRQTKTKEELERLVKVRTADLEKANRKLHGEIKERRLAENELREKTRHLQEVNTALNVLLDRREKDKDQLSKSVLSNVKELVLPYVDKLKRTSLSATQRTYMEIIEKNLQQVISPFIGKYSFQFYSLTPMEIQVADLIKIGKSNKEMAEILNLSLSTILTHRHHIRAKLGLKGQKINLCSYLNSLV